VIDLLYSGRLERYPNIRYILAHGGGSVPYLAYRIASGMGQKHTASGGESLVGGDISLEAQSGEVLEKGIGLLKRLYYDTASPGQSHLAALQEFVGTDHLVFGTDGGWTQPVQTAQTINTLMAYDGFDPDQLIAVERDNAFDLFPRLAQGETATLARSA
jgi:predicted TIM-barrel fold metal-dependent hydrolase